MRRCLRVLARLKHFYFLSESEQKGQLIGWAGLGYSAIQLCCEPLSPDWCNDALSASLDAGSLLTELLHRAACALTFITVCGVLSTLGTPIILHRCCSGNYWIYQVLFKVGNISLHHLLNVYFTLSNCSCCLLHLKCCYFLCDFCDQSSVLWPRVCKCM